METNKSLVTSHVENLENDLVLFLHALKYPW